VKPKSAYIELGNGERLRILYEDRAVLAIDKPAGWMLVPVRWQNTGRNLQAALLSCLASGAFWVRSRNLKFLRYVHRLDADTTGVLLLAKSRGALEALGDLFEARQVHKTYLAVVGGRPLRDAWTCRLPLAPDPQSHGRVRVNHHEGKQAETQFRTVQSKADGRGGTWTLIEARPVTGRTHQIRVHLVAEGFPVLGDALYGRRESSRMPADYPLGLRAVTLAYRDPFTGRPVRIEGPTNPFLDAFGFGTVEAT
jgi:RluA family pseudouridine synthase